MATERLEEPTSSQADTRAAAAALVTRTCAAQGLPAVLTDPGTLDRVAALIAPQRPTAPTRRRSVRRVTNEKAGTSIETLVPAVAEGNRHAPLAG